MAEEGYNGWANYETWLLALNVDNDQYLYNERRAIVREALGKTNAEIGDALKEWLEELAWKKECDCYKICATWDSRSWGEIDWIEVAEAWKQEVEDEPRED